MDVMEPGRAEQLLSRLPPLRVSSREYRRESRHVVARLSRLQYCCASYYWATAVRVHCGRPLPPENAVETGTPTLAG